MTDIFEEVEGQLRVERYRSMAMKAAPIVSAVLGAALLIALAVWGLDSWRSNASTKASEAYDAAGETYRQGDVAKAFTQFGDAAKAGSPAYASLALMQQGGMRLEAGNVGEAVEFFDKAAKAAPAPELADMARLKSAFALLDTAPYKDIEARLKPLTEDKRPYRLEAKEALAFAKLRAGMTAQAKSDFSALTLSLGVPESMRQRAQIAVAFIDSGAAGAIPAAVKAAMALPPASAAPQGMPAAGPAQP